MTADETLENLLAKAWPPAAWQDVSVLAAVSGGADSVALLRGLARLKVGGAGRLLVAHFNHGLRGAESEADAQFVVELARQLALPCHVEHAPSDAVQSRGDGLEAAAREARYRFLQATAERTGARYVVTAHTADDQSETILQRVVRGTGVAGLAGIPRTRPLGPAVTLIRPLLDIRRTQVETYLAALGQPFRTDSTNQALELTRNRVRHRLLPILAEEFNPAIVESLLRLGKLAADAQRVVDRQAEVLLEAAIVRITATSAVLNCEILGNADRHLVREALLLLWRRQNWPLQAMGYAEWEELAEMAFEKTAPTDCSPTKKVFPGEIMVKRGTAELRLDVIQDFAGRTETVLDDMI